MRVPQGLGAAAGRPSTTPHPHNCLPQISEVCVSVFFGEVTKDQHRDDRGSPPSLRPDGREADGLKFQEEGSPWPAEGLTRTRRLADTGPVAEGGVQLPGSVLQAPSGIFRIRQGGASHTFKEKFPPLPRLAEEHLLSV